MAITVKLDKFADILRGLPNVGIEKIKKGTISGVARSIPNLVEASPVDTGLYAQSWNFTANEQSVILGNTAPHASIIEEGTRKFKPPIGPLLAWAKRVLGDGSQPPNYSSRVWGLALYTQKKIEENGIVPKKVLENTMPRIIENIRQEIEALG